MEIFIWVMIVTQIISGCLSLIKFGQKESGVEFLSAVVCFAIAIWGYSVLP